MEFAFERYAPGVWNGNQEGLDKLCQFHASRRGGVVFAGGGICDRGRSQLLYQLIADPPR